MRRIPAVLFVFILMVCVSAQPVLSLQFEGIISLRISSPDIEGVEMETIVQRFYIKEPYMRLEAEGGMSDIVVLIDNVKREMYVLDYALNRYTTDTFDEYTAEDEYNGEMMEFDLKVTDEKKNILEYEAELLEFVARGDTRESFDLIKVWATSQLGTLFRELLVGMRGNEAIKSSWHAVLIDRKLFPLKTSTYFEDYILEETQVIKIELRELPDSLFEIPAGFRQVDLRN